MIEIFLVGLIAIFILIYVGKINTSEFVDDNIGTVLKSMKKTKN